MIITPLFCGLKQVPVVRSLFRILLCISDIEDGEGFFRCWVLHCRGCWSNGLAFSCSLWSVYRVIGGRCRDWRRAIRAIG